VPPEGVDDFAAMAATCADARRPSESLAFDLYGTLVDPASQADVLAQYTDDPAGLAACWRRHQREVSWLLSLMGRYEGWVSVTPLRASGCP
jgi:hypothetical protein